MQIYVVGIHEIHEVQVFATYEKAVEAVKRAIESEICVLDITLQRFTLTDGEWVADQDYDMSDILSDLGSLLDDDEETVSVIDSCSGDDGEDGDDEQECEEIGHQSFE